MTLGNLSGGAHCPCQGGAAAAAADAQLSGTLLLPAPLPAAAPPSLSARGHLVVAVCLGSIGTLGFLSNLLVLALFARCRALRTPMNLLLVSISASDLLVNVLGTPFSFAASTQGRWLIGRAGCVWYGFVNASLGIVSLVSLAVLSYERYCTMVSPTMASGHDYRPALAGICFSWLYSLGWTVPPLVGWSRYGPEGPGTTCSVDWRSQSANNVSYIVCLFTFCLLLPFCIILYSYGKLLCAIRQVSSVSSVVNRRREQRVLLMVVTMVLCYLVCWLPYGVVALLSTFRPGEMLSPEASIVPSLLAKFSTVVNPFIYIFMNKQFSRCFKALLTCSDPRRGSALKPFSRMALGTVRQTKEPQVTPPAPSSARPTTNPNASSEVHSNQGPAASAAAGPKPRLTLVARFRE
ncbi:teleost multiple tissue opsin b [Nelusetta ayraudi]|uniref:teleost multiple tissue opsin b n=1 Tax=Nelusetta ayraudi TaxID=303726 RepID=UPI003F6E70C4